MTTKLDIHDNEYLILLPSGRWILPGKYKQQDDDFAKLVQHEILGNWSPSDSSACVELMHRLKLAAYEELSDAGHLKYLPRGAVMKELIAKYAKQQALQENAIPIASSILYDREEPAIAEHLALFGENSYVLNTDNRSFVMRHAACYGQFAMLKGQLLSYRDLPLSLYELADCYRYELSGTISGLSRQRRFSMPDIHAFCERDAAFAKVMEKFSAMHSRIFDIAAANGLDYYSVYNIRSDFLVEHSDIVKQLVAKEGKPVVIRQIPKDEGYYWVLNIEFCIIDASGRPIEVATIQIDVDNAQRFDISYQDADGKIEHPIIIHVALLGSVERFLDAVLEEAAVAARNSDRPVLLPIWIAPLQFRIIPLAERHEKFARKVYDILSDHQFRGDIDNRAMTLSRRIVDAEAEAIELVVIIGDNEVEAERLSIRDRRSGEQQQLSVDELVRILQDRVGDWPSIDNPLPVNLKARPAIF